ncbi:tetratricopeptide repeat protein [Candidatus Caldatribacterium saccharofermentans]|uniref:tetratricopeptide repeat protein n=1 Tax=Candidatus Caldatribacterium saccharofermentans TaxID=1454753 RepID=UPI003D041AE4
MRQVAVVLVFVVVVLVSCGGFAFAQTKEEYYRTGYIYFSQRDYARALEAYRKALEMDPQFVDARYWLGKTLEQMGQLQEAVKEWRLVLLSYPRHWDAFQKWRAYAPSFVQDGAVVEKYRALFLEEESPVLSREEGWSTLAPLALVLLGRKDFSSLYLAAWCFRWAKEHLSPFFAPYEERALQGALENLTQDDWMQNPRLVYRFLQEVTLRFGGAEKWQEMLRKALNRAFAYTLGLPEEQGAEGVELTLHGGEVEKRIIRSGEVQEPTGFFLRE